MLLFSQSARIPEEHNCPFLVPAFNPIDYSGNFKIPRELNVHCPAVSEDALPFRFSQTSGQRQHWIIRNRATEIVEVFWVSETGKEVYEATLAPEDFQSFQTFEGHVFHVRSAKTHRLLLKHVVGITAIQPNGAATIKEAFYASAEDAKEVQDALHDAEALQLEQREIMAMHEEDRGRVDGLLTRHCNFFNTGFLNEAGEDLEVYTGEDGGMWAFTLSASSAMDVKRRLPMNIWYEHTYVGHYFKFFTRSGELVHTHEVETDFVVDCPSLPSGITIGPPVEEPRLSSSLIAADYTNNDGNSNAFNRSIVNDTDVQILTTKLVYGLEEKEKEEERSPSGVAEFRIEDLTPILSKSLLDSKLDM